MRLSYNNNSFIVLSSNAATLYNAIDFSFCELDLSDITLKEA